MTSTPREEPAADKDLDRSLVEGIAWTGGVKWTVQLLRWGSTLVVARILDPTDYGLMGMALVYIGFVQIIREAGLVHAIVQREEGFSEHQLTQLGGLSVTVGILLCSISVAVAGWFADFFREPAVRPVIMVLSANFVVQSFRVVPQGLLTRELRFKELAVIEGTEGTALAFGTVILAILGFDYWALVLGTMIGNVVRTLLTVYVRPHRIGLPTDFSAISDAVQFGVDVVGSRIAWYAYSNADFAIVGRVLGANPLGAYTIGWNLASVPIEKANALLSRVGPGVLASVQTQPKKLRRYVCGLTEGVSLITVPATLGLALVAQEFVLFALGEKWLPAVVPLQILAFTAGFRSLEPILTQTLISTGRTKQTLRFSLVAALILPPLFYVGSRWGTMGVAAGWLVGYPVLGGAVLLRWVCQAADMRVGRYLKALWPAASSAVIMGAAVLLVRELQPSGWAVGFRFASLVGTGVVAYAVMLLTLHRSRMTAFRGLLRRIRSATADASEPASAKSGVTT